MIYQLKDTRHRAAIGGGQGFIMKYKGIISIIMVLTRVILSHYRAGAEHCQSAFTTLPFTMLFHGQCD